MEINVIQVPAGRGKQCLHQSTPRSERKQRPHSISPREKKAEKPRKIKYINASDQTTSSSQTSWISGTNPSRILTSDQLTNWVVQEFSFLPKNEKTLFQKQSKEREGMRDTHLAMVSTHARTFSRSLLKVWISMTEAATGSTEKYWGTGRGAAQGGAEPSSAQLFPICWR